MMRSAGVLVPRNFHDLRGEFNQNLSKPYVRSTACVGITDVVRRFRDNSDELVLCFLGRVCILFVSD